MSRGAFWADMYLVALEMMSLVGVSEASRRVRLHDKISDR